ncbi:MAG: DUF503 domain-containing protein [Peptococcaceae bacterium]|jgi:uncharacterized protein YlxP (DUF503 family)|nr:DUF503 domain-containing protein [Peptococcaceae bacterium]MDH7526200.1 DUF503 domain-containing protein [Peptococcaceae bacterium]
MFVCVLSVRLHIFGARSLKEKRSIIKSLLEKTRNRFGLAIAEVGDQDLWQSSRLGIAMVAGSRMLLEREMEKVLSFLEQGGEVELVEANHEIWGF